VSIFLFEKFSGRYTPGPPLRGEGRGREGRNGRGEKSEGRGRGEGRGGWRMGGQGKGMMRIAT
jgi:hypothetical protein